MADTVVYIEADIVEVDDEPRYRLYGGCTDKGDLLDQSIFLMEIIDPNDALSDTLARVVHLSDLDSEVGFKTSRVDAVLAGDAYWRNTQFTRYYTDVEVASAAKTTLQDEVNRLVNEYDVYKNDYETGGSSVSFPTADSSILDTLVGVYDDALVTYNTALADQATAATALTTAQDDYDEIKNWLEKRDLLSGDLGNRTSEMTSAQTLYATFLGTTPGIEADASWVLTEIENFLQAYDDEYSSGAPLEADRDALEEAKNKFSTQRSTALAADVNGTINNGINAHSSMDANTYYLVSDSDLNAAQTTLASATTDKASADAEVTATYAALETAYNAVKAVDPTWTPDEPLPPDPSITQT